MTEIFFEVFEGEKKLGKESGGDFRLKLSFNNINQFASFKHNFFIIVCHTKKMLPLVLVVLSIQPKMPRSVLLSLNHFIDNKIRYLNTI